jgi:hypothetical protein
LRSLQHTGSRYTGHRKSIAPRVALSKCPAPPAWCCYSDHGVPQLHVVPATQASRKAQLTFCTPCCCFCTKTPLRLR